MSVTYLRDVVRSSRKEHADDNDPSTDEHCLAAAEAIREDGGKGRADHRADSVEREDDTSKSSVVLDLLKDAVLHRAELLVEVGHGEDGGHERAIVTVGESAATSAEDTEV